MTWNDLVEKGAIIAKEIGAIVSSAFQLLYDTDSEVIGKYVLILLLAVILIIGIRLLGDEIGEYRSRREKESGRLPWYLRDRPIFFAIAGVIIVLYAVLFVLIL